MYAQQEHDDEIARYKVDFSNYYLLSKDRPIANL